MFAVASAAASAVFENPRLRDSGSSRTSTSLRTPAARSVSISELVSACCSYPVVNTVGIPAIFDMTSAVLRARNRAPGPYAGALLRFASGRRGSGAAVLAETAEDARRQPG